MDDQLVVEASKVRQLGLAQLLEELTRPRGHPSCSAGKSGNADVGLSSVMQYICRKSNSHDYHNYYDYHGREQAEKLRAQVSCPGL